MPSNCSLDKKGKIPPYKLACTIAEHKEFKLKSMAEKREYYGFQLDFVLHYPRIILVTAYRVCDFKSKFQVYWQKTIIVILSVFADIMTYTKRCQNTQIAGRSVIMLLSQWGETKRQEHWKLSRRKT